MRSVLHSPAVLAADAEPRSGFSGRPRSDCGGAWSLAYCAAFAGWSGGGATWLFRGLPWSAVSLPCPGSTKHIIAVWAVLCITAFSTHPTSESGRNEKLPLSGLCQLPLVADMSASLGCGAGAQRQVCAMPDGMAR